MSSEDDPAPTPAGPMAIPNAKAPPSFTVPTAANAPEQPQAPHQQQQPVAPLKKGTGSGDSEVSNASSRPNAFWQSSTVVSAEPQSLGSSLSTPASMTSNGSHFPFNKNRSGSRWTKARSTSTESSLSLSGMTTLGSMYNQDGFPNYPPPSEDEKEASLSSQPTVDDAAIAKQLALTDEAVRSINGTSSVVQARGLGLPPSTGMPTHTYELPRSLAAFVRRQPSEDNGSAPERQQLPTGRSFVSSGSSTSSEESEHLASVQWVKQVSSQPSPGYGNNYFGNFQQPARTGSPKMPPPQSTNRRLASPRQNGGPTSGAQLPTNSVAPSSGSNSTPTAPGNHPLPTNNGDGPSDGDDDDAQTVGLGREGSPSSSSASGLDLLSLAAAHHERPRHSQGKRKAGAEAVAQWRNSGIPSGTDRPGNARAHSGGYDSPGYESTPSDGQRAAAAEPPKKRRRSEMQLEQPEERLRQQSSEGDEEAGSDYDSDGSGSGSEYHGKSGAARKPIRGGNKGKNKQRVRSTLPVPPPPSQVGPGGKPLSSATPKKGRKSSPPSSGARGRRSSAGDDKNMIAGGVQCEYVNPLPPYQRCPDVFTRKYDIPRHMARHARREGDLVAEGKLPEEKALLWKTIRDKPRIRCKTCGEYFTRQDALKRHQAKQHHH